MELVGDLNADKLSKRYPDAQTTRWGLPSPITVVEITMRLAGTNIDFGPRSTQIGGATIINCFAGHCRVGLLVP